MTRWLLQTRDQRAGRWGATPKTASSMKSMLHKKESGNTFMSNTTVVIKELKISVELGKVVTTLNIIKH